MKKKLVFRMFALFLSALMSMDCVSVYAGAVSENSMVSESLSEDASEEYFLQQETNLFEYDFKQVSDEELDAYLLRSSDEQIAAWMSSLSEIEKEELMKRDTLLNRSLDYYGEGCQTCGYTWESHFDTAAEYYETLANCEKKTADYNFASASGYIEIAFVKGNNPVEVSRIKITNLDTSKKLSTRQMNISCSVLNAKYGLALQIPDDKNWHTWDASSVLSDVENDLKKCQSNGPESVLYDDLVPEVYFKKPVGYKVSKPVYSNCGTALHAFYQKSTRKNFTYGGKSYMGITYLENAVQEDATYDKETEVRFYASANIGRHYGVGLKSGGTTTVAAGNYERATFTFTPAQYTMQYEVNGGSGNVASQVVNYGGTYSFPSGPAAAEYHVTYNANGGKTSATAQAVPRKFQGWSNLAGATSGVTGVYTADKTANGGTVKNYAVWGEAEKNVTLPVASKDYVVTYDSNGGMANQTTAQVQASFQGWSESQTNTGNVLTAGTQYKPKKDVTLYAQYDKATVTTPDANRTGYQFEGWFDRPNEGVLVAKAGEEYMPITNATLYAQWNPISYQISLDVNGGEQLEELSLIDAVYDQSILLPVPKRTGYIFKGWESESSTYRAENVVNLTEKDGDVVKLTAAWEATDVAYQIRQFFRKKGSTDYVLDESKISQAFALADSQITVPAPVEVGYETPASQLVTIKPDGSTVVDFYYDEKEASNMGAGGSLSAQTVEELLKRIRELESISKLSKEEWDNLASLISAQTGLHVDQTKKLEDVIKNSGLLSENEKKTILEALANGYISEELRDKLIQSIQQSGLSNSEKETLIQGLNRLSNLSIQEQQKIKELLEIGSSVSYKINGITFEMKKNPDGTLSILLKGLNGQKNVVIPDSVAVAGKTYAVTEIAKDAFKGNNTIESVTIGNNVTKVGESAFENCKALKKVVIGPNVKEIGAKAWKGCSSLTSITIPESVLTIGTSAFENCTNLKTVVFKEGLLQIGKKAFYNCKNLTKIKVPKSVLKIKGYAFGKCSKMKTVTFAAGSLLVTLNDGVFSQCTSLSKIKIPSKVNSIPKKAFYKDSKLAKVTGMNAVTKIGESAFESCKSMKTIILPTKVQTIGKRSFYQCKSLKKVTVKSKALTSVGEKAFKKCKKGIKFSIPAEKQIAYARLFKNKY